MRLPVRPDRLCLRLVGAGLLAAVAGLCLTPVLGMSVTVAVVFPAALVSSVIVVVMARSERCRGLSLCAGVAGWLAGGLLVVRVLTSSSWTLPRLAWRSLVDGPKLVLTSQLPSASAPVIFLAWTVTWWAAYGAGRAVLARRSALLMAAGPFALFLAATSVSAPLGMGQGLWSGGLFAALVLGQLAAPGFAGGPGAGGARPAGVAAVTVAVLAGTLVATAATTAALRPFDPRTLVSPPREHHTVDNPLALADAWGSTPDSQQLFDVVTSKPAVQRMAVLDAYDGVDWSGRHTYAGYGVINPPSSSKASGGLVDETVTIGAVSFPWLPAPGQPMRVTGTTVAMDAASGEMVTPLSSASRLRYRVQARGISPASEVLARAVPASGPDRALPPGLPPHIAQAADQVTGLASSPYDQMVLLKDWFRVHLKLSPSAPPGRAGASLGFVLTTSHQGTASQLASLFAVMARQLGFPSRVVVGFHLVAPGTPQQYHVRSADVAVWPEVDFAGAGWVAFDPVASGARAPSVAQPRAQSAAIKPPPPARSVAPAPASPVGVHAMRRRSPLRWSVPAVAGSILVLLAWVASSVWVRFRRRRGTPRMQALAAWRDMVGRLTRTGQPGLDALTATETSIWVATQFGPAAGERVARFAAIVNDALYSPVPLSCQDAAAAWQIRGSMSRIVRRHRWRSSLRMRTA